MSRLDVVPEALEIVHLDEDWDVPCEAGRDVPDGLGVITCRGANPASFVMWTTVCCPKEAERGPVLICKQCLDEALGDPWGIRCAWCNHEFLPSSTAIRLIEPLNRRTA